MGSSNPIVHQNLFKDIDFSIEKARRLQSLLSKKVIARDCLNTPIKYVAGVDIAYYDKLSIGAVAVFDYNSLKLVELKSAAVETRFPYIPTLLSFREIPAAVSSIRKLNIKPDVFLVDGQGIAHPYRFGFASHLGVVLDLCTVGVAKSLLCGEVIESESLNWRPIIHEGEIIGGAVFTKPNAKPVYVSVGHKISLETAIKVVLTCSKNHRIPEPLHEAHSAAQRAKREAEKSLKVKSPEGAD
ncbi:MAG: deoxyribonuclease V [Candidatus Bathyarchaeota archaeon]|nr:deoxyribonuclease V [Candidatus Bathyarchaeota archaeon]